MSESELDPSVIIARHVILRDELQARLAALETRLKAAELICRGIDITHKHKKRRCGLCDLLAIWREAAGK